MWRVLSETDPNGGVTHWQYDATSRVTRTTHPNGGFETYVYNDIQRTKTHRTILGASYVYRYTTLGQLHTITAPGNQVILTNIYDNRMRLASTRNAQGMSSSQNATFSYDVFDRETEKRHVYPCNHVRQLTTTTYSDIHDTAGNSRITTTIPGDANAPNIVTFVQYDRFGRKTQEGTTGGKIVTYTHDMAGRVTREQSLGVDNHFTYNVHGVTSVRNIEGSTSTNNYDSMGRLTRSRGFYVKVFASLFSKSEQGWWGRSPHGLKNHLAILTNLVNAPRYVSSTVPVGPFLCFAMMISA